MNNKSIDAGTLFDGRYKLLRPLSSDGGTADVWLALDINTVDEIFNEESDNMAALDETGIKVAIKIYRPKNALDLGEQRFREEFKIVFNCHHTNLVQPINFSIYEGIPYLVLPYCEKGSSEALQGKALNGDEIWRYISDVSAGLAYLHAFTPTIVHHDIKPANILIDDNNNYAITDFGISSQRGVNREGYDETRSGTTAYMAPERFSEDYESITESDIWSFGASLYELITGRVPFGEEGGLAQKDKSVGCPPISNNVPSDIKKLIYDCLSLDPAKRPTASSIKKAADNKRYPLKNRKWLFGSGALLLVVILSAIILPMLTRPKKEIIHNVPTPVTQLSDDERFEKAMKLVNDNESESLKKGLTILDTLGARGYVPALYEQAFTYGYYKDSASLARKELLGIEFYPKGSEEEYIPKSKQINIKAIGMFTKIEELADPDYPEINANALYRLACYYVNKNDVFQKDIPRAKVLLTQAKEWAVISGNQELVDKIDRNLNSLVNNIKDN